jgi:hypothetical protein
VLYELFPNGVLQSVTDDCVQILHHAWGKPTLAAPLGGCRAAATFVRGTRRIATLGAALARLASPVESAVSAAGMPLSLLASISVSFFLVSSQVSP